MNGIVYGKLAVNFIRRVKKFKRSWQATASFPKTLKPSQRGVCFYQVSDKPSFISDSQTKDFDSLNEVRKLNPNSFIVAHININSIRNKFEMLKATITDKTAILLISEIKLGSSFLVNQFLIDGFTPPYRIDRNANGGSIMLCVREDIPPKLLSNIFKKYISKIYL